MSIPAGSILRRHMLKALATAPLLSLGLAGCSHRAEDARALRIATPWPRSVREELAREFIEWLGADRQANHPSINWITIPEGEPLDGFLQRERGGWRFPDVLVGGPVDDYARLAAEGRLEGLSGDLPRPYWREMTRRAVGPAQRPARDPRLVLGDPRVDPLTRAWCFGELEGPDWPVAYAKLIDRYGRASLGAGWGAASARAAFDQGRADETIAEVGSIKEANLEPDGEPSPYVEGAAVRAGSSRAPLARDFLRFLGEHWNAELGAAVEGNSRALADARGLAADLLGATLVDAQDELRIAAAAVREAGSPEWAVELLNRVPPWPPASVEKLLAKEGESGLELLETLVGQVAPEAGQRVWLTRSWLKAARPIDGDILAEIARAEGGRLAREPRFRAWLRAEWTQWARQRYRWVARSATTGAPPRAPALTSLRGL